MAHRFLGNDYPVPQSVIQSIGIKSDIAPTHCDVITETEYLRVGPLAQMSYDDNYNMAPCGYKRCHKCQFSWTGPVSFKTYSSV